MYGISCSLPCGTCLDYEQCHHINGTCLKGCDKGYYGQLCKQGKGLFPHSLQYILYKYLALRNIEEKYISINKNMFLAQLQLGSGHYLSEGGGGA